MSLTTGVPGPPHNRVENVINSTVMQLARAAMTLVIGPLVVASIVWTGNNFFETSRTLAEIKQIVSSHTEKLVDFAKTRDEQADAIKKQVESVSKLDTTAAVVTQQFNSLSANVDELKRGLEISRKERNDQIKDIGAKFDSIDKRLDGDESRFHSPR